MRAINLPKVIGVGILFLVLASIRFFEGELFYDPLIQYFKNNYLDAKPLPNFNFIKLLVSVSIRYWLNTFVSLVILYISFRKMEIVKFSAIFYVIVYIILLLLYSYLLVNYNPDRYLKLFYVRRFLIHPLLILLLLPAFYYQSKKNA